MGVMEVDVVDVVVIRVVVAVGAQEHTELYLEGAKPPADVKREGNSVVAVETPCV